VNRPKTRYAKTEDGVHIGYQVFGEGSNDLVIHLPLLSNVDAVWDLPDWAAVFRSFGSYARVILFDRRGLGVSDRPTSPDVMAVEKGMDDMRAVMDEVGSKRAALLGYEAGGTVMLLFAASYPDRVSALAPFSPLVFSWKTPDFPWGYTEEEASEWRSRIESEWGTEDFWRWNLEGMGLATGRPPPRWVGVRGTPGRRRGGSFRALGRRSSHHASLITSSSTSSPTRPDPGGSSSTIVNPHFCKTRNEATLCFATCA
jgi:pimeloyl-ACP methyl ester carboxylesterase